MDVSATNAAAVAQKRPLRHRIGLTWVVLSSVAIAGYFVGQYMTGTLHHLAQNSVGLSEKYSSHGPFYEVAFYMHIVFAGTALFIGPFQFIARLRDRHRSVHRTIGGIYLVSVLLGGAAALIMATINTAGINGFFGFGTLAVLWVFTAGQGYRAIRARDFAAHQAWMMRSFALTYAAVMLRLWVGVLIAVQIPFTPQPFNFDDVFTNAYGPVPWICWLPNLVVVEFLIRRAGLPSLHFVRPESSRPNSAFPTAEPASVRH